MKASSILKEIKTLPTRERIEVIEKTLTMIREESEVSRYKKKLERAARLLLKEYRINRELTALSGLDGDDFYEASGHLGNRTESHNWRRD